MKLEDPLALPSELATHKIDFRTNLVSSVPYLRISIRKAGLKLGGRFISNRGGTMICRPSRIPASGVQAPCRRKTRYGLAVLGAKARGPFVSIAKLVLLRSRVVSWSLPVEQPIPVPGGRQLKTLRDEIKHLSGTVPKISIIMRRFSSPLPGLQAPRIS